MNTSASMATGRRDPTREARLSFPVGFPRSRVEPLFDPTVDVSPDYRRAITRTDPLLFALVYLPHHLVIERQGYDLLAFSEWHLDFVQHARQWLGPRPRRSGWVVPRKGAKSTWVDICALWALAHGHKRMILLFSHNADQARTHLANLRRELDGNALLVEDFPGLAPARVKGGRDTLATVTRGGSTLAARSVGEEVRGMKFGTERPDLIVLDDVEPDGERYSIAKKTSRLSTIMSSILPMNEDAEVVLVGTTVMYESIAHDLVLAAIGRRRTPWIVETQFEPHYYPAILDEGGPNERSLWPAMWSLGWLLQRRGPVERRSRTFALEYDNRPETAVGGLYWTRDDIVVDRHFEAAAYVMTIDVAVTQGPRSDFTAIAITSVDRDGRRFCVEHIEQGRISGTELRDRVHALKARNPDLTTVIVEVNQGGSRWREILSPLPPGVTLVEGRPDKRGSKRERTEWLLSEHVRGAIVYRRTFDALFEMMVAWPDVAHDDMLDAVEAGVAFHQGLAIS